MFAKLGVHNVIWVWNTEGYLPHERTIAALYPGNAYVDWIGYDPYNYYTCHQASWQSFAQTVQPFYQWLTTQPFGDKPVMLVGVRQRRRPAATEQGSRLVPGHRAGHPPNAAAQGTDPVERLDTRMPSGRAKELPASPRLPADGPVPLPPQRNPLTSR